MSELLDRMSNIGIVPVAVLDDAETAVPVAKALREGGINCAEVTFRTAAAEESIKKMTTSFPDMLIGAGTVLSIEQVNRAVNAGAKFIVTPGYNPTVVNYCIENQIPIIPGCMDTNAIEMALEAGLDTVKFFPAEASGGIKMMKALAGPYVNLKYLPTGGINSDNLVDYLSYNKTIACGGSWMVKPALVKEGRYEEIVNISKQAIRTMLGFELAHVGINEGSSESAEKVADSFGKLFDFEKNIGNSSIFVGNSIEVTKSKFLGEYGHIAIGTNSLHRAIYYLQNHGVELDIENAKIKDGKMVSVYLKDEIAGFAIHLVEK